MFLPQIFLKRRFGGLGDIGRREPVNCPGLQRLDLWGGAGGARVWRHALNSDGFTVQAVLFIGPRA